MRVQSCLIFVLGILLTGGFPVSAQVTPEEFRVIGHYSAYDVYDDNLLTDIPARLITHLYYGPIGISTNSQCESTDEWADTGFKYPDDEENERQAGNFKQLRLMKEQHPDLQIIMSIGGWENSGPFTDVAADENLRVRFVRSCLAYMRDNDFFDGINIDWRYPVAGGVEPGSEDDIENFRLLLADFRGQIEYWAERDERDYTLTINAPAVPELHEVFRPDLLQEYVDWINLTTYGYRGAWSDITGHVAPLYGDARDPRGEIAFAGFNVDGTINAYLDYGVPAEKLVVGIAFYGQAWRNVRPGELFGLYEFNDGVPDGAREGGTLYYQDIRRLLDNESYTQFYDDISQAAWLYNEERRIAISYENPESLRVKMEYIRARELGGVFIWELLYDDSDFTLLNTVIDDLGVQEID